MQGSIDLLIENADGQLILVDYKTDHISNEERTNRGALQERMKKVHQSQLSYYQKAVAQLFGKAPDKTLIYSLPLGDAIEMD